MTLKERRAEARKNGNCGCCVTRAAAPEAAQCGECQARARKNAAKLYADRRAAGLCVKCTAPAATALCATCSAHDYRSEVSA